MKFNKEEKLSSARTQLRTSGIKWEELNEGYHFKIGCVNYYPTTDKWHRDSGEIKGTGIRHLIKYIESTKKKRITEPSVIDKNQLTVEQIFNIASHSKDKSLMGICESIHREIYK